LPPVAQVGRSGEGASGRPAVEEAAAAAPKEYADGYRRRAASGSRRSGRKGARPGRDPGAVPAPCDLRDQRARRRAARPGRRAPRPRPRERASARGRLPAQAPADPERDPGGRGVLRPLGAGAPQVAAAPRRRPPRDLRDELPQVRHRGFRRREALADARAPHRAAAARRRDGRRDGRVPRCARVPALRAPRRRARRRAPTIHADDRRHRHTRHRRVARRAVGEDELLERVQDARHMVGRAAAVLSGRRPGWRLAGLLTALVAWDALAAELPAVSDRRDVALVAIVLIPAGFAVAWLLLPFAGARGLLPIGLGLVALCVVLDLAGLG